MTQDGLKNMLWVDSRFPYAADMLSAADPNREQRDYALPGDSPLVGLIDNPWYPPYMQDCSHCHNCMEIGICLTGRGAIELNGRILPFGPGSVAVAGRGLHHSQRNEGEPLTHWRYVVLDEDVLLRETPARHHPGLRRFLDVARQQGILFSPDEGSDILRPLFDALFGEYDGLGSCAPAELELMAQLLIAVLVRNIHITPAVPAYRGRANNPVEPALEYVSENYMRDISVAQLASSCALSESYFRKLFTEQMHMPPLEYVNRFRVNRAVHLLRTTTAPLAQIASEVGFPSPATFNRNFRRYAGQPPAHWRKTAR